jgi:cellulase (glycosyl hydrolase family 5)
MIHEPAGRLGAGTIGRALAVSLLALLTCSCGGGDGGSGGGGLGAVVSPTPAPPSPPVPPPPPPPPAFLPAAAAMPKTGGTLRLGKCVNISDMLEAPNEGDWGRAFEDSDIANIKAKGFTAIRLPARFSAHAGTAPPYTIDPVFMARARHITDLAVANGLAVIVDMHHYLELFDDPAGQAPRFAELWRQIGIAFKDEPASVSFELINEPNKNLTAANLTAVLKPALDAVRASNPTRPVVWDGPDFASGASMLTTAFPDDPNIVPTFHYYDPANFAFDTAPWMNPSTRNDFGTADDVAQLKAFTDRIAGFIAGTGRVPFAGEYGAHEIRPDSARATYYATVSAAFASIGVQSCAWGYNNTYNLWRDGSGWVDHIADGIVTTTTLPPG